MMNIIHKKDNIRLLTQEEYIEHYGEPDWEGVSYDNDVYIFIDNNDKIVGDCVLFTDDIGVKVDNFEIRTKYKGYGRICVDLLKEKFKYIDGESVLEAMGFWNKMGAVFNQSDLDSIPDDEDEDNDKEYEYDYDYDCTKLIRFRIG